jgi:hypothetical protein
LSEWVPDIAAQFRDDDCAREASNERRTSLAIASKLTFQSRMDIVLERN